jgi:type III secretion protein HrpB1
MSVTRTEYLNVSPEIVGGLIEVVSCSLLSGFPKVKGDPLDIELVLDALHVLRPTLHEIDTFEGIMHMSHGRWDDAIQVFSRIIASAPHFSYAKALMAFCLSAKGDPNWRQSAAEAIEANPSKNTFRLVRSLEARDDFLAAKQTFLASGQFVAPPSCTALADELAAESVDGRKPATGNDTGAAELDGRQVAGPNANYLRV